jgi:acyl-CoA thioester hydrolase
MTRHPPGTRAGYRAFVPITTRWMDNDVYGHVNNVIYYAWFDTAVNRFLIDAGVLDIAASEAIGIVAETGCRYHAAISYPDAVTIGLRIAHLGRSSVRYEVAAFREADNAASAEGHFVHVYVDRASMRPVPIPEATRAAMQRLLPEAQETHKEASA